MGKLIEDLIFTPVGFLFVFLILIIYFAISNIGFVVIAILLITFITIIVEYIRNIMNNNPDTYRPSESQKDFVKNNSVVYKELLVLNNEYSGKFKSNIDKKYKMDVWCSSKKKLDSFDGFNYVRTQMYNDSGKWATILNNCDENYNLKGKYDERYNLIVNEKGKFFDESNKQKIIVTEQKLVKEMRLTPAIGFDVELVGHYNSPKGRNHWTRTMKYHFGNEEDSI